MSRYWPPTMPPTPAARRELGECRDARVPARPSGCSSTSAHGLREQPVAGEDGHGLAEADVARGLAAAEVVVVHRRQVVVDQAVGVDQLDRGGEREDRLARSWSSALGGGEREHRPDALAAREQRVAHRLLEALGGGLRGEASGSRGSARPAPAARSGRPRVWPAGRVLRAASPGRGRLHSPLPSRCSSSAPSRAARSAQRSTRSAASAGVELAAAELRRGVLQLA